MRWLIRTRRPAAAPLDYCRAYAREYDLFYLKSIKLEKGKQPYGVYGWLDFLDDDPKGWDKYSMTLHIPGPFPYRVSTREPKTSSEKEDTVTTSRGVLFTVRDLNNRSEGLVWLFGHELFHYLASTKQTNLRNTEYHADHFANSVLDRYRDKVNK